MSVIPQKIIKNFLKNFTEPIPSTSLNPLEKKNNRIIYDACPQKTNIKLDSLAPK